MSKTFTREEVARHTSESDLWIIIDTDIYDLSRFVELHPGGVFPLMQVAGKDATDQFYEMHKQDVLLKYKRFKIGTIAGEKPQIHMYQPGELSKVPYAESSFFMGYKSPYYSERHTQFRQAVRKILDELKPQAQEYEATGERPSDEFTQILGKHHLLAANIGPDAVKLLPPGTLLPGGIKVEEYDYFFELVLHEEFARWVSPGTGTGVLGGMTISLPTVVNFAKPHIKAKVVPEVLSGQKRMALAISEPYTGSDVAGIKTTATLSADGSHYIVNGVKKWISTGRFADYFSTAVRTDKGISMLLIERSEGVETKAIHTSYAQSAGTAYVSFENVKVPVENLLGVENQGFKVVLSNFNHERYSMLCGASMAARIIIQDCFKWANQRKVFGKRLIDQPVIRNKLAGMISQMESMHAWLENLTYQMNHMSYNEQSTKLAGPLALCKYQMTRMLHNVADDACQIFGGRAITKTGMGRNIETFQRTYKFSAILGGSEEIMADLGVRQAMKYFPRDARL
ncbi:acyl-CoA dehydrogenase NM domain-like protein [Hesseltinella vesiculosa]|uniref:Acyl-CoA dehydrogenase NM domain-like protein n=1 Tax=Hesseltinella vesiculosa TaxID=101127 RepID=A0A1X2GL07_9FUNG|nr:acyl-CoA dehydrogenase NM domain-like protein [Hesseltinella vesiculosa]